MAQTGPVDTSSPHGDIRQMIEHTHTQILALFQLYLGSPPDARQAIVEQILRQLAAYFETEEDLLFQEIGKSGPQGRNLVREAELEREEIMAMILALQSEGDDDQTRDEFFEDMMQSVRVLFMIEKRDLFATRRPIVGCMTILGGRRWHRSGLCLQGGNSYALFGGRSRVRLLEMGVMEKLR